MNLVVVGSIVPVDLPEQPCMQCVHYMIKRIKLTDPCFQHAPAAGTLSWCQPMYLDQVSTAPAIGKAGPKDLHDLVNQLGSHQCWSEAIRHCTHEWQTCSTVDGEAFVSAAAESSSKVRCLCLALGQDCEGTCQHAFMG